jgi:S-DNA-T family DNA segregation ATPase FtsK/SpoIIIE
VPDALRMCELHKHTDGDTLVPRLRRVVCTPSTDRLVVRMLMGQSPEHFRRRSAELAYTFGARHAQVSERRPSPRRREPAAWRGCCALLDSVRWADRAKDVHIVIVRRDCLVAIVAPFPPADSAAQVDFTALPLAWSFLGRCSASGCWQLTCSLPGRPGGGRAR